MIAFKILKRALLTLILGTTPYLVAQNQAVFSLGALDLEAGTVEVWIENDSPVHSFNINVSGIIVNDVYGGAAEEYGYHLNFSGQHGNFIHGWMMGMENDPIPAGEQLLFIINFEPVYDLLCIYNGQCQGNNDDEFDVDLDNCLSLEPGSDSGYFNNILNGYLSEYLDYAEATGDSLVAYVTIEASDDLDFGDDIGLLSFEGNLNYGDCSDEIGEILVGSDFWYGGPLTIPAYGALDFCDEGGFQLPGFTQGEPISVHIWDASEATEYEMNLTQRDDIPWNSGNIIISDMSIQALVALGGDLDQDGMLSVADAVIMVDYILGIMDFSESDFQTGDLNTDGDIDILDVVALIEFILQG